MKKLAVVFSSIIALICISLTTVAAAEEIDIYDSINISEETLDKLEIWTVYSNEETESERCLSEDVKSIIKVYNVPIRFAFSEFNNIEEVLKSNELLGEYYVVEHIDGAITVYDESLNKRESNRYTEADGKMVLLPPIDLSNEALEVLEDEAFIKQFISREAEVQNVYYLSGESSMMGTAIYYKTNIGDYVYYNHFDIGEKIFPIEDFCRYQQAICAVYAKNPEDNSGVNLDEVWDLSQYELNDNNDEDNENVTTTIADSISTTYSETSTTTTVSTETTTTVQKHYISDDDILRLSKKGDELTWSDFEQYEHTDVGSGILIWELEIKDSGAKLQIGGNNLEEKPNYINYDVGNGVAVDIRTEDMTLWFYNSESDITTTEPTNTSTNMIGTESTTITTNTTVDTTTASNNNETLPQTGYSKLYKVIAGLAALMTVSGAAIVVKTKKKTE